MNRNSYTQGWVSSSEHTIDNWATIRKINVVLRFRGILWPKKMNKEWTLPWNICVICAHFNLWNIHIPFLSLVRIEFVIICKKRKGVGWFWWHVISWSEISASKSLNLCVKLWITQQTHFWTTQQMPSSMLQRQFPILLIPKTKIYLVIIPFSISILLIKSSDSMILSSCHTYRDWLGFPNMQFTIFSIIPWVIINTYSSFFIIFHFSPFDSIF